MTHVVTGAAGRMGDAKSGPRSGHRFPQVSRPLSQQRPLVSHWWVWIPGWHCLRPWPSRCARFGQRGQRPVLQVRRRRSLGTAKLNPEGSHRRPWRSRQALMLGNGQIESSGNECKRWRVVEDVTDLSGPRLCGETTKQGMRNPKLLRPGCAQSHHDVDFENAVPLTGCTGRRGCGLKWSKSRRFFVVDDQRGSPTPPGRKAASAGRPTATTGAPKIGSLESARDTAGNLFALSAATVPG